MEIQNVCPAIRRRVLIIFFFTCPIAKSVWIIIAKCFGANNVPTSLERCWIWCDHWFQNGRKFHTWGISALCWAIWKARNRACFDNILIKNPIEIICHAAALIWFWTGLYEEVDKTMLINGVNTMLRVAADLLLPKGPAMEHKHLKYDDSSEGWRSEVFEGMKSKSVWAGVVLLQRHWCFAMVFVKLESTSLSFLLLIWYQLWLILVNVRFQFKLS